MEATPAPLPAGDLGWGRASKKRRAGSLPPPGQRPAGVVRKVGSWTFLGKRALQGPLVLESHETICNKRPRAEGPLRLRRVSSSPPAGVGVRGTPPAGVQGSPAGGAAGPVVDEPVGIRPRRAIGVPVGVPGRLAAGPFWRTHYWEHVTSAPLRGDLVELAAANQLDTGLTGEPEHRLWRSSPYGPRIRLHGTERFPRDTPSVSWGPVSRVDRDTAAHAAVWQPPDDPG